jgi:hypothetical protein
MGTPSFLRRAALGAFGTALAAGLLVVSAQGSEIAASGTAGSFVIHGPEETLRDFCAFQDGRLWLVLPGGSRFELIQSTDDPAITNPGDGQFHPFDEVEVRAALAASRYPLDGVCADVFLLPYPRRGGLQSAAGPELILLSPGVLPLPPEHQHAELFHELGHVIQYARMPDPDASAWASYRKLRGIADATVYNDAAPHADRPHEIFAEDFRSLFGDALANYSGTIENADITPPDAVAGLADFIRALPGTSSANPSFALTCFPNPSSESVLFARSGAATTPIDVFDLAGRRVARLDPVATPAGVTWAWDGRGADGVPVGAGLFFARPRDGSARTLRVTRLR